MATISRSKGRQFSSPVRCGTFFIGRKLPLLWIKMSSRKEAQFESSALSPTRCLQIDVYQDSQTMIPISSFKLSHWDLCTRNKTKTRGPCKCVFINNRKMQMPCPAEGYDARGMVHGELVGMGIGNDQQRKTKVKNTKENSGQSVDSIMQSGAQGCTDTVGWYNP